MKEWNELPKAMRNEKVKYYYDILQKHQKEGLTDDDFAKMKKN